VLEEEEDEAKKKMMMMIRGRRNKKIISPLNPNLGIRWMCMFYSALRPLYSMGKNHGAH
jgi:hypothetical protein